MLRQLVPGIAALYVSHAPYLHCYAFGTIPYATGLTRSATLPNLGVRVIYGRVMLWPEQDAAV